MSLAILLFCSSHIANGQSLSTSDKKAIKYYDASRTQLGSRQFDEAIESLNEKGKTPSNHKPRVLVQMALEGDTVRISISDNGIGLPEDRSRLFEPYVTTREKGTGLGLSIVKKIIEEHGGTLTLSDADQLDSSGQIGARADIVLSIMTTNAEEPSDLAVAE